MTHIVKKMTLDDTNSNIHHFSPANTYHTLVIHACGFLDSQRSRVRHLSTKRYASVKTLCGGFCQWSIMDHTKITVLGYVLCGVGFRWLWLEVNRMAESMQKPRRTRGTVAYNARRYFGWGVLIVGAACGLIFQYENFYTYD